MLSTKSKTSTDAIIEGWACESLVYKVVGLMYIFFFGFFAFVTSTVALHSSLGWWTIAAVITTLGFCYFLFHFLKYSVSNVQVKFTAKAIFVRPLLALRDEEISLKYIKQIEFIGDTESFVLARFKSIPLKFKIIFTDIAKQPIEFLMVFASKDPYLNPPYSQRLHWMDSKTYNYQKDFMDVVMGWRSLEHFVE